MNIADWAVSRKVQITFEMFSVRRAKFSSTAAALKLLSEELGFSKPQINVDCNLGETEPAASKRQKPLKDKAEIYFIPEQAKSLQAQKVFSLGLSVINLLLKRLTFL